MKKLFFLLLFIGLTSVATSQNITGSWEGSLQVSGMELPLVFHIKSADSGYTAEMDSPAQQAFGIPVDEISFENGVIKLRVAPIRMTYSGKFNEDTETFSGDFEQSGMQLPLELRRVNKEEQR